MDTTAAPLPWRRPPNGVELDEAAQQLRRQVRQQVADLREDDVLHELGDQQERARGDDEDGVARLDEALHHGPVRLGV